MKTNKFWSILVMLMMSLCATISFTSCGGDDDDDDDANIVGSWRYTDENYNITGEEKYLVITSDFIYDVDLNNDGSIQKVSKSLYEYSSGNITWISDKGTASYPVVTCTDSKLAIKQVKGTKEKMLYMVKKDCGHSISELEAVAVLQ